MKLERYDMISCIDSFAKSQGLLVRYSFDDSPNYDYFEIHKDGFIDSVYYGAVLRTGSLYEFGITRKKVYTAYSKLFFNSPDQYLSLQDIVALIPGTKIIDNLIYFEAIDET